MKKIEDNTQAMTLLQDFQVLFFFFGEDDFQVLCDNT